MVLVEVVVEAAAHYHSLQFWQAQPLVVVAVVAEEGQSSIQWVAVAAVAVVLFCLR